MRSENGSLTSSLRTSSSRTLVSAYLPQTRDVIDFDHPFTRSLANVSSTSPTQPAPTHLLGTLTASTRRLRNKPGAPSWCRSTASPADICMPDLADLSFRSQPVAAHIRSTPTLKSCDFGTYIQLTCPKASTMAETDLRTLPCLSLRRTPDDYALALELTEQEIFLVLFRVQAYPISSDYK